MLDGVVDQVPQDPADPPGVDVGDEVLPLHYQGQLCVRLLRQRIRGQQDFAAELFEVHLGDGQLCGAGVEAGHLQQVSKQRLESLDLVVEQLCGSLVDRIEIVPGFMQHFGSHSDRGQRRAQFVGDI